MKIDKKQFCDCIEAIRLQSEHDEKCTKAFQTILTEHNVYIGYDNHWIKNALMGLLQTLMNDISLTIDSMTTIEFFCNEMDFGKKHKENNQDIFTSEKLYEFLKQQMNEKN